MDVEYANAAIEKDLAPSKLVARHGAVRAKKLRRLLALLQEVPTMADIAALPQCRLHWLKENLVDYH